MMKQFLLLFALLFLVQPAHSMEKSIEKLPENLSLEALPDDCIKIVFLLFSNDVGELLNKTGMACKNWKKNVEYILTTPMEDRPPLKVNLSKPIFLPPTSIEYPATVKCTAEDGTNALDYTNERRKDFLERLLGIPLPIEFINSHHEMIPLYNTENTMIKGFVKSKQRPTKINSVDELKKAIKNLEKPLQNYWKKEREKALKPAVDLLYLAIIAPSWIILKEYIYDFGLLDAFCGVTLSCMIMHFSDIKRGPKNLVPKGPIIPNAHMRQDPAAIMANMLLAGALVVSVASTVGGLASVTLVGGRMAGDAIKYLSQLVSTKANKALCWFDDSNKAIAAVTFIVLPFNKDFRKTVRNFCTKTITYLKNWITNKVYLPEKNKLEEQKQ